MEFLISISDITVLSGEWSDSGQTGIPCASLWFLKIGVA
jgi:hypothetical protein